MVVVGAENGWWWGRSRGGASGGINFLVIVKMFAMRHVRRTMVF
jgi:hypothetical protein